MRAPTRREPAPDRQLYFGADAVLFEFLLLHIVAIIGFAFRPLGDGGVRSRLLGADLRRQRHEVGVDIVPDLLVLDVPGDKDQRSGVVAGQRRNRLGGAREGKTAENQGGAGCAKA